LRDQKKATKKNPLFLAAIGADSASMPREGRIRVFQGFLGAGETNWVMRPEKLFISTATSAPQRPHPCGLGMGECIIGL